MLFKSRPSLIGHFTSKAKKSFNTLVGRSSHPPAPRTLSSSSSFESWIDPIDPDHRYDPFFVARQGMSTFDSTMFDAGDDDIDIPAREDENDQTAGFYRLHRSKPSYNLSLLSGDFFEPPVNPPVSVPAVSVSVPPVSVSVRPALVPATSTTTPGPTTTASLAQTRLSIDKPLPTLPPTESPKPLPPATRSVTSPSATRHYDESRRVVSGPPDHLVISKATVVSSRSVRARRRMGRTDWSLDRPRVPSFGIEAGTIDFTKTPELRSWSSNQSLGRAFALDEPTGQNATLEKDEDPVEELASDSPVPAKKIKSDILTASPESDIVLVFSAQNPIKTTTNESLSPHKAADEDPFLFEPKPLSEAVRGWGHFKSLSSSLTKESSPEDADQPEGRKRLYSLSRPKITEATYVPDLAARHKRAASLSKSITNTLPPVTLPPQSATAQPFRPKHRPSPSLQDVFQFKNNQFDIPIARPLARPRSRDGKWHVKSTSLDSTFAPPTPVIRSVPFDEVPPTNVTPTEARGTLNNRFRFPAIREGGMETLAASWSGEYDRPSKPHEQVGAEEEAAVRRLVLLRSESAKRLDQDPFAIPAAMPPTPPRPRRRDSLGWSENWAPSATRRRQHPPSAMMSRHRASLSIDSAMRRLSAVSEGDEVDGLSVCGLESFLRESEDWADSEGHESATSSSASPAVSPAGGRHRASYSIGRPEDMTRSTTMTSLASEVIVTPDRGQNKRPTRTMSASKRHGLEGMFQRPLLQVGSHVDEVDLR